ncbi:transglycosylase domain-containing protein [Chondrinema litorale]|uniref:transglycosylase domain-containing protein n=1 Tax=Chondrinema litorale TaxID=2994555 RepID=UPI002543A2D6|nr:transglycosylase domain-containing protein [Chondrinema litorale]UZR95052.1 transglycosylase domain-containing protein [Chondrinema litorale]
MYLRLIKIIWFTFFAGLIALVLYVASVYGNWNNLYGGLPDFKELENPKNELASLLYTADDKIMGKYFVENRDPVKYSQLSPNLVDALKAVEDVRFEMHSGIDFRSLTRVFYGLVTFDRKGGGSTLTQQLAKILFSTRGELSNGKLNDIPYLNILISKTKEWILAIELERAYTKEEIMTMYLNTASFSGNIFGIKAASKTFFNTIPDSLDILQAATLSGMLQAPTRFNPHRNPENSKTRRNTVLYQMEKYGFLNETQFDTLSKKPVTVEYKMESHNTGYATYFRNEIAKDLKKWCATHYKPNGEAYNLYTDGLKIYTTIDSRMQKYAEEAVQEHMAHQQELFNAHWKGRDPWINEDFEPIKGFLSSRIRRTERYRVLKLKYGDNKDSINKVLNTPVPMTIFSWTAPGYEKDTVMSPMDSLAYYKHFLHTGLMSMDPATGYIKAWVGGIDHRYFQFDNVKQGYRQPGSTFKPITYSAAIVENKMHPCYKIVDSPVSITLPDGTIYTPKNSGSYSNKEITLRQAIAMSKNTAAANIIKILGPDIIADYAENKFGIGYLRQKYGNSRKIDRVYSLCLGTSEVSLFELVAAYSVFPNQGVWTEPIFITHIEDKDGKVLETFVPKTIEALSEEDAYTMTYMLRGSNEEKDGTSIGLRVRQIYDDRQGYDFIRGTQVGGKTGTTSNYSDGWFVGVTKNLITGVWVGGEENVIHFRSLTYGQGGRMAMPEFAKYTEKVYADKDLPYHNQLGENGDFIKPDKMLPEFDCWKYDKMTSLNPADSLSNKTNIIPTKKDDDFF